VGIEQRLMLALGAHLAKPLDRRGDFSASSKKSAASASSPNEARPGNGVGRIALSIAKACGSSPILLLAPAALSPASNKLAMRTLRSRTRVSCDRQYGHIRFVSATLDIRTSEF
jgi:hypothetical protein